MLIKLLEKFQLSNVHFFCGHQLEHVDKAKYLDVTIQSDLKWDSHINNITTKANKTFGFLRIDINISSTTVKEHAYKFLVRSSFEYVFLYGTHIPCKENPTQLERVQRIGLVLT